MLIRYAYGDQTAVGFAAIPDAMTQKRPAVIVFHDWTGRNTFANEQAQALAQLGYVGFAADLYGEGKTGQTNEEKMALMSPLMTDRSGMLQTRLQATLDSVQKIDNVDKTRIAAIGFCFGGLCALDLARTGAHLRAAVSFHGLLTAPEQPITPPTIQAKLLVLHGHDDPMVSPAQVAAFAAEMTNAGADWQIHTYGRTMHAFTNPQANDAAFGTVYQPNACRRSMASMRLLLEEAFL